MWKQNLEKIYKVITRKNSVASTQRVEAEFGKKVTKLSHGKIATVEPLFYDHPQNQIGVVVAQGWSSTRGLIIL